MLSCAFTFDCEKTLRRHLFRSTSAHLVGQMNPHICAVVGVGMDGEADVAGVIQHQEWHSAGHQHVRPNVELTALQKQRVAEISMEWEAANSF